MKASRVCPSCGKQHNTVLQNNETDEVEVYFPECRDCLMSKCFIRHPTEQIQIRVQSDGHGDNQNDGHNDR